MSISDSHLGTPTLIFLTGFSGTGKSVTARNVANSLGWRFLDIDQMVANRAGQSIEAIFENLGESRFRDLEREIIQETCNNDYTVVATGGGAIEEPSNIEAMLRSGFVVCLEAQPPVISKRLKQSSIHSPEGEVRPLLKSHGPVSGDLLDRIVSLKAHRQSAYSQSHWTISTDYLTASQVADEVIRAWRLLRDSIPTESTSLLPQPACVVRTSSGSYPIYVDWGLRDNLPDYLSHLGIHGPLFIITDETVFHPHVRPVQVILQRAGIEAHVLAVPPGEPSKSQEGATLIYQWLVERRAERGNAILSIGGGMVGDLAGFVAATFLRGLPFIQMPTSLAAMVDAAIGGKVAVNLPQGKNLVGAFSQPRAVISDLKALASLPSREQSAGWAETIKHALILDSQLLQEIESETMALLTFEPSITANVIRRSVAIKSGVVTEDEHETKGRRALLNYGHTVAHALEAATEYRTYLHGEAVAIGMTAAAEIGQRLGVTPDDVVNRQATLLARFSLPLRCPGISVSSIITAMKVDKKMAKGEVHWVLLTGVGKSILHSDVPPSIVQEVLKKLTR